MIMAVHWMKDQYFHSSWIQLRVRAKFKCHPKERNEVEQALALTLVFGGFSWNQGLEVLLISTLAKRRALLHEDLVWAFTIYIFCRMFNGLANIHSFCIDL